MGRMKLVKRKRRRPDGSYEWILDTPDWYERELRRKEIERKYLDPALNLMLDSGEHVSRFLYRRVFPRLGRLVCRVLDSAGSKLYDRLLPEPKVEGDHDDRLVRFLRGPFSRFMTVVAGILVYGYIAYLLIIGVSHFFSSLIKWIME